MPVCTENLVFEGKVGGKMTAWMATRNKTAITNDKKKEKGVVWFPVVYFFRSNNKPTIAIAIIMRIIPTTLVVINASVVVCP